MRRLLFGILITLLLAGCGTQPAPPGSEAEGSTMGPDAAEATGTPDDTAPTTEPSPSGDGGVPLPDGWRWESYGGVQVGVPSDWGVGGAYQRIQQWCTIGPAHSLTPVLGRPEPTTAVGCLVDGPTPTVPPELSLEHTGTVVAIGGSDQPDGNTHEGDRTTVHLAGVAVVIQAEPELREWIAATVHAVDIDAALCPINHQIAQDPTYRPAPSPAGPADVSAISACRYELQHRFATRTSAQAPLISSLRLTGADAQAAAAGVVRSEIGGGPNAPDTCAVDWAYGDEVIVLLTTSASGESETVLRYAGCDHHGFDDGTTVRTLTAQAVAPFIQASNVVTGASSGMGDILLADPGDPSSDVAETAEEPPVSGPPTDTQPFDLYTHCGIGEVHYEGGWYQRVGGVLHDGNGNPPKGWDNPSQEGTMARIDENTIMFTEGVSHQEFFTLRAGATSPKDVCA